MLYGAVSFLLGIGVSYIVFGLCEARYRSRYREQIVDSAARAVREVLAEAIPPKYARCPKCDAVMLASTVPFVAPGSHN